MASRPIKGLADRLCVLQKIAWRFVSWRFELDELVNQMWLSKAVRIAEQEHHLARAGRNAIYDYFRSQFGRTERKSPVETPKEMIEDAMPVDFSEICKGLTRTQKLILRLRSDWFSWSEVAKVIGISKTNTRYQFANIPISDQLAEWGAA